MEVDNKLLNDIFKRAKEILEVPGVWTRHVLARARCGTPVGFEDPEACKFCAVGAIYRAVNEKYARSMFVSYDDTAQVVTCRAVELLDKYISPGSEFNYTAAFNDAQESVEPVLELFNKAISETEVTV